MFVQVAAHLMLSTSRLYASINRHAFSYASEPMEARSVVSRMVPVGFNAFLFCSSFLI